MGKKKENDKPNISFIPVSPSCFWDPTPLCQPHKIQTHLVSPDGRTEPLGRGLCGSVGLFIIYGVGEKQK